MKFKIESCVEEIGAFSYKVYCKNNWYNRWKQIGNWIGYRTAEECFMSIDNFIEIQNKLKEYNNCLKDNE